MSDSDTKFLRRREAADYLRRRYGFTTLSSLAKFACCGGGPRFSYAGDLPLYRPSDLDEWAQAQISAPVRSTSERRQDKSAVPSRREEAETA